jgi:hypothetical protein
MASNFSFFPVSSNAYWEINMQDMEVNLKYILKIFINIINIKIIKIGEEKLEFCKYIIEKTGVCGVAVDSGTSLIAGPTEYINIILDKLNVKEDCSNYD